MKNNLSIIIPVYGKKAEFIKTHIGNFVKETKDVFKLEIIIVYKNSADYNYDFLLNLSDYNVKVIKANENFKKTKKVFEGIKNSNSKYILVMDSHHSILKENLVEVVNFIDNLKFNNLYKAIFMNLNEVFYDKHGKIISIKYRYHWNHFSAGSYIVNAEEIKKYLHLDLDVVYGDDWTLGMLVSTKKIKVYNWQKGKKINLKQNNFDPYLRIVYSDGTNSTSNILGKEHQIRMRPDFMKVVVTATNQVSPFCIRNKVFDVNLFSVFYDMSKRYAKYTTKKEYKTLLTENWKQIKFSYRIWRFWIILFVKSNANRKNAIKYSIF